MCTNQFRGTNLPLFIPSRKFYPHFFALFLSIFLATFAPNATCYATNTFGSLEGSLTVAAGTNTGSQPVTSLGSLNLQRSQDGESAEASLSTNILSSNLFQFSLTAETTSATGSAGTGMNANFQLPFEITENMRVFLTAEISNNPSGGDVSLVRIGINDGNRLLEVGLSADTGGSPASDSLIFPAATDTHLISGIIIMNANSPGTLSVSAQGTVAITKPSDINGDLSVDGEDLGIWMAGFGTSLAAFDQGDMNDDLQVNGGDFLQWQREFGATLDTLPATATIVPEPATALLAAWGFAQITTGRRRRWLR